MTTTNEIPLNFRSSREVMDPTRTLENLRAKAEEWRLVRRARKMEQALASAYDDGWS
jgi:hypothetical protein